MARFYLTQGKIAEAEELFFRDLTGCESTWVQDHLFKVNTVYNLGLVYTKQGKTAEAVQMYQRALGRCEEIYGPEHKYTQRTAAELNNLYHTQENISDSVAGDSPIEDMTTTSTLEDG
jgi:tetratricopeptide (TPR) repeat protein